MRAIAWLLRRIAPGRRAHVAPSFPAFGRVPRPPVRYPPHPANVPGPFYVEDGCCLACGVWESEAPGLLAWLPDAEIPHCYVARQPESDAEFAQMMTAMRVNEVDCIRVHSCRPDWAERLRDAGLGGQIDPPEGPAPR